MDVKQLLSRIGSALANEIAKGGPLVGAVTNAGAIEVTAMDGDKKQTFRLTAEDITPNNKPSESQGASALPAATDEAAAAECCQGGTCSEPQQASAAQAAES